MSSSDIGMTRGNRRPSPPRPASFLGPRRPRPANFKSENSGFQSQLSPPIPSADAPAGRAHIILHPQFFFGFLNAHLLLCKSIQIQPVCLLLGYPLPPPCRHPKNIAAALAARKGSGRRVRTLLPRPSVRLSEAPQPTCMHPSTWTMRQTGERREGRSCQGEGERERERQGIFKGKVIFSPHFHLIRQPCGSLVMTLTYRDVKNTTQNSTSQCS